MKLTARHARDAIQRWSDEAPMMMPDSGAEDIFDASAPNSAEGARELYDQVGNLVIAYMAEELTINRLALAGLVGVDEIVDVAIKAAIIATLFAVDEAGKG